MGLTDSKYPHPHAHHNHIGVKNAHPKEQHNCDLNETSHFSHRVGNFAILPAGLVVNLRPPQEYLNVGGIGSIPKVVPSDLSRLESGDAVLVVVAEGGPHVLVQFDVVVGEVEVHHVHEVALGGVEGHVVAI